MTDTPTTMKVDMSHAVHALGLYMSFERRTRDDREYAMQKTLEAFLARYSTVFAGPCVGGPKARTHLSSYKTTYRCRDTGTQYEFDQADQVWNWRAPND